MRLKYWDFTEELNKAFNSLDISKSDISTLIGLELFISGCHFIDPSLHIDQAWSVLVGYDEPILKRNGRMEVVSRLRILFPELRSKKILSKRIQHYQAIDQKFRLFDINEKGIAEKITPRFITNRQDNYEKVLNNPIPRQMDDTPFASQGSFEYSRIVRGGIYQHFHGIIPEVLGTKEIQILPAYRKKIRSKFQLPFNCLDWTAQMDEVVGKAGFWTQRGSSLVLDSINHADEFVYQGNQHIVGGLGAGKSTFMILETYRLVKQEKARVGFIEGSVSQVIERVNTLRELGINAVPIIGKSSRRLHQENYLFANAAEIKEISDWSGDKYQSINHLSDVCVIKALSEDHERNYSYPCTQLIQGKKSVKCPLASCCGVYRDLSRLNEADVWVATSASVLRTHIPAVIDPYERTVFEAMYDLLDVVFVDEADEVQKQFDETFLSEYNVFGKLEDIFERLLNESNQLTSGRYGQFAGDPVINEWKDKLRQLDQMIWRIYTKLNHSHTLRKNISRNLIRLTALSDTISEKLSNDSDTYKRISKALAAYATDPYKDPNLSRIVNQLVETDNPDEKQTILTRVKEKLKGHIQPRVKQDLFYAQLEFYLYLCRAEECIKFILTSFSMVQAKLGMSADFSPLFTMQKDYQPFMKEAMTGTMIGYKYDLMDGETTGAFKLVEYTGVGRLLLHDWHHIYENSDLKQGPAVIFLSGTSHAPNSAHYNLLSKPEWILKADRIAPEIRMAYKPILNTRQGNFIAVSGIRDEEVRQGNLYEMVGQLKSDIQYELDYWKKQESARRVLLVVNSYDDVATVGRAFRGDRSWEGRYKILSKERNHEPDHFPRSMIESFYKEKSEVLIVPLLSVGRGYNILDHKGEALFGSVFFLVRPYPTPNDMNYLVQMLHAYLPNYLERIGGQKVFYDKAITKLRQISNAKFESMFKKPDFWSILNNSEREIMAWFIFIPIWQMIGRLLRGGKNARVFYCDSKFHAKPVGNADGMSMLESWAAIMQKHRGDPLFDNLYGPFAKGITNMIQEAASHEEDGAFALEIDESLFYNETIYYMKMPESWRNFFNKERKDNGYKLAYKVEPLGKKLKSIFPEIVTVCSDNRVLLHDQPWLVSTKPIPVSYIKMLTLGWLAHLKEYSITQLPEELRNEDLVWVSCTFGEIHSSIDGFQWIPGMAAILFCQEPKFLDLGNELREEMEFYHVIFNGKHECISKPIRYSLRHDPFSYVIRFELKTRGGDAERYILTVSLGTRRYLSKAQIKDGTCYMRSGHACSVLVSVQNPYVTPATKSFSQLKFEKRSGDKTSFTSWETALDGLYWDVLSGEAFEPDLLLVNPKLYAEGSGEITAFVVNNNLFHGNSVKAGIGLAEKSGLFNLVKSFLTDFGAKALQLIPEISQRGMNDNRFPMIAPNAERITLEIYGSEVMFEAVKDVLTTAQKSIDNVTILEEISDSHYRLYSDKEVNVEVVHCNPGGIVSELEIDKYKDHAVAETKRINQIMKQVTNAGTILNPVLALVEIEKKDNWREGTDPKNAIREGMKKTGRLSQFIYPLTDDEKGDISRIINGTLDLFHDYGFFSDNLTRINLPGTLLSISVLKAGNKYLPTISRLEGTELSIKMLGFDSWMTLYEAALRMDEAKFLDNPRKDNRSVEVFEAFITREIMNELAQDKEQVIVLVNATLRNNWMRAIGNTKIRWDQVPNLNEQISGSGRLKFIRINATDDVPQYRIFKNDSTNEFNKASGIFKDPIGIYYGVGGRPSAWKGIPNETLKITSPSKLLLQQRAVEYIPLGAKTEEEKDSLATLADHLRRLGLTYDKHTIFPYTMRVLNSLSKYITGNEDDYDYDAEFEEEVLVELSEDLSMQY